jgi:hypothetical protein
MTKEKIQEILKHITKEEFISLTSDDIYKICQTFYGVGYADGKTEVTANVSNIINKKNENTKLD